MSNYLNTARIFKLNSFSRYTGSESITRTVSFIKNEEALFILKTNSENPCVYINGDIIEKDYSANGYIIYKATKKLSQGGFFEIKIDNLNLRSIDNEFISVLLVQDPKNDKHQFLLKELDKIKTAEEFERKVWGISRKEVGYTEISPENIEVGCDHEFEPLLNTSLL